MNYFRDTVGRGATSLPPLEWSDRIGAPVGEEDPEMVILQEEEYPPRQGQGGGTPKVEEIPTAEETHSLPQETPPPPRNSFLARLRQKREEEQEQEQRQQEQRQQEPTHPVPFPQQLPSFQQPTFQHQQASPQPSAPQPGFQSWAPPRPQTVPQPPAFSRRMVAGEDVSETTDIGRFLEETKGAQAYEQFRAEDEEQRKKSSQWLNFVDWTSLEEFTIAGDEMEFFDDGEGDWANQPLQPSDVEDFSYMVELGVVEKMKKPLHALKDIDRYQFQVPDKDIRAMMEAVKKESAGGTTSTRATSLPPKPPVSRSFHPSRSFQPPPGDAFQPSKSFQPPPGNSFPPGHSFQPPGHSFQPPGHSSKPSDSVRRVVGAPPPPPARESMTPEAQRSLRMQDLYGSPVRSKPLVDPDRERQEYEEREQREKNRMIDEIIEIRDKHPHIASHITVPAATMPPHYVRQIWSSAVQKQKADNYARGVAKTYCFYAENAEWLQSFFLPTIPIQLKGLGQQMEYLRDGESDFMAALRESYDPAKEKEAEAPEARANREVFEMVWKLIMSNIKKTARAENRVWSDASLETSFDLLHHLQNFVGVSDRGVPGGGHAVPGVSTPHPVPPSRQRPPNSMLDNLVGMGKNFLGPLVNNFLGTQVGPPSPEPRRSSQPPPPPAPGASTAPSSRSTVSDVANAIEERRKKFRDSIRPQPRAAASSSGSSPLLSKRTDPLPSSSSHPPSVSTRFVPPPASVGQNQRKGVPVPPSGTRSPRSSALFSSTQRTTRTSSPTFALEDQ